MVVNIGLPIAKKSAFLSIICTGSLEFSGMCLIILDNLGIIEHCGGDSEQTCTGALECCQVRIRTGD